MTAVLNLELPKDCPFYARRLNRSIYLIREQDQYGQFPNIYAKICQSRDSENEPTPAPAVIVLSDSGCATNVKNSGYGKSRHPDMPEYWNIGTVLRYTGINPGGRLPHLVITTHCHFDHICGLGILPPTDPSDPRNGEISLRQGPPTTVLASAHDPDFINPWEHLCVHSLCKQVSAVCPYYSIDIWAQDRQQVGYSSPSVPMPIPTGIIILQTPGHTPDSLSWYDTDSHLLSVGDSFYEVSPTDTTFISKWGGEIRGPIMFEAKSDLAAWWRSLDQVLQFTREQNAELRARHHQQYGRTLDQVHPRVSICAGHVTTLSPDAESFLLSVRAFVSRILRDEVPKEKIDSDWSILPPDMWCWDDGEGASETKEYEWIVWSPMGVIEDGRERIPRQEWI